MRISIAVLLSLSIACLSAQDTRGNISGTVTDPQGASIARAGVIVTNANTTNATKLTTTPWPWRVLGLRKRCGPGSSAKRLP